MKTFVVLLCATTILAVLLIAPLDAGNVRSLHADVVMDEASANFTSTVDDDDDVVPIPRQEEEERPYEYVPRVFHSLRKIIKGVLNGSIHDIFHGSFSFAPQGVSNEIIGVYNQVVGFRPPPQKASNATFDELLEEFEEEDESKF